MPISAARQDGHTIPSLVSVDGRTFPLRASRIEGRAEAGLAATTLIQEYANPHAEPLEVIYTMPLPADGAVLAYTIRLGDRTVTGRIEPREAAREQYLRALEEGRTAGLLEQHRADTFSQTLGSLPPGVPVQVEIEVLHPLIFRTGGSGGNPEWEYRFATVVGVRYEGAAGRVADSGSLDVDRASGTPVRLTLELLIADGDPAATAPRSPSHEITIEPEGTGTRLQLASATRVDRDLVVRWSAARDEVAARLAEGRGLSGDDGRYAVLTITPPAAPAEVFVRDLTLLVDASGSMSGAPLEHAKRIVQELLKTLGPEDRFEVLVFSETVRHVTSGLVNASAQAVEETLSGLRQVRAGGGTEMVTAVLQALEPLRADSQRQVVLLTDGQVGFEHEVVAQILAKLHAGARLHTVGIGSAPNRALTRAAARAGRGVEVLVGSEADAQAGAAEIIRATAAPVLTDVSIRGTAVQGVAPQRPRDMFAGEPLRMALELRPAGGTLEFEGRLAGHAVPWTTRMVIEPRSAGSPAAALPLGALYGRECVEDLEMQCCAVGSGDESVGLTARIEALGLRHRIVTRRTSLVAISEDATVDPQDPRRRERLAVELPHGVSAEGVGLASGGLLMRCLTTVEDSLLSGAGFTASLMLRQDRFDVRACEPVRMRSASEATGRIVSLEGGLLRVEFESPSGGSDLPDEDDVVIVEWEAGDAFTVRVVPSKSTRPGHHGAGLTLRLALAPTPEERSLFQEALRAAPLVIRWSIGDRRHVVRLRPA